MNRILLLCGLVLCGCVAAPRGASAQAQPAPVIKAASPTTPLIRFEVVSIRRNNSQYARGPGFTDDGFTVENNGLWSLLTTFGVSRIVGVPDGARIGWDIRAKVADSDVEAWKKMTFQQHALAVRAMMEDRFHLKWHIETRQTPGYAMVVAKGGQKFKEATPGDAYPNGFKNLGGGPLTGVLMGLRDGSYGAQAITMGQLADSLEGHAGKPVVDKTGLTGKYDLNFKAEMPGRAQDAAVDPATASEPTGASIFTILQEQLGLKLEPGAMVPQDFLVIDHVDPPTEN